MVTSLIYPPLINYNTRNRIRFRDRRGRQTEGGDRQTDRQVGRKRKGEGGGDLIQDNSTCVSA